MSEKIKISEKEFYEKVCSTCFSFKRKGKACYENGGCDTVDAIKRFDVFEIIPEKTALEKAREYYEQNYNHEFTWDMGKVSRLKNLFEQHIKELDAKLDQKNGIDQNVLNSIKTLCYVVERNSTRYNKDIQIVREFIENVKKNS